MPGQSKTRGARNNARRFTRNRKFNRREQRKEVLKIKKLANDRAKFALIMIDIAKRYAALQYGVYDIGENVYSATVFRNILYQMLLSTTGEFNRKFDKSMPFIFTEIKLLAAITLSQFFILVSNKLDLEDVKWGQLLVDSDDTSALNAVSNISGVLGKACTVLAYGARCAGRNNVGNCFNAAESALSCVGSACNAANVAARFGGHVSGTHPLTLGKMGNMALTTAKLGAGAFEQDRISTLLDLPETYENVTEAYKAAATIPAQYTVAPRALNQPQGQ